MPKMQKLKHGPNIFLMKCTQMNKQHYRILSKIGGLTCLYINFSSDPN